MLKIFYLFTVIHVLLIANIIYFVILVKEKLLIEKILEEEIIKAQNRKNYTKIY